jgi:hypothetical protein
VPGCIASPPSSSRPTTVFASRLLFLIRHAIFSPPPSRGPWSACIRAVPSVALSSTASDQCVVHHCSWHHFSRGQHFVEHLNCIFDTATPAPIKITVAYSGSTPPCSCISRRSPATHRRSLRRSSASLASALPHRSRARPKRVRLSSASAVPPCACATHSSACRAR